MALQIIQIWYGNDGILLFYNRFQSCPGGFRKPFLRRGRNFRPNFGKLTLQLCQSSKGHSRWICGICDHSVDSALRVAQVVNRLGLSLTCVSSTLRHHSISRNALPDTLFRNFSACAVCCNDNFVGKTQDSKHENLRSVIMKWIVRCHIFEMASTPLKLNLSCREQECSNRRLIWSASKTIQLARSYERDYKASRGIMNHETNQMEET